VIRHRVVFLGGALWEILRFAVLLLVLTSKAPAFPGLPLHLLWFGASQLALVAALVFMAITPQRYPGFIQLLRIGVFLSIPPGLAVFLSGTSAASSVTGIPALLLYLQVFAPAAVVLLDLLFLVFLLSYTPQAQGPDSGSAQDLPDYRSTTVEEE